LCWNVSFRAYVVYFWESARVLRAVQFLLATPLAEFAPTELVLSGVGTSYVFGWKFLRNPTNRVRTPKMVESHTIQYYNAPFAAGTTKGLWLEGM